MTATNEEVAMAFTEWERRARENPEEFPYDATWTPEEYGMKCAEYFEGVLAAVQAVT